MKTWERMCDVFVWVTNCDGFISRTRYEQKVSIILFKMKIKTKIYLWLLFRWSKPSQSPIWQMLSSIKSTSHPELCRCQHIVVHLRKRKIFFIQIIHKYLREWMINLIQNEMNLINTNHFWLTENWNNQCQLRLLKLQ